MMQPGPVSHRIVMNINHIVRLAFKISVYGVNIDLKLGQGEMTVSAALQGSRDVKLFQGAFFFNPN